MEILLKYMQVPQFAKELAERLSGEDPEAFPLVLRFDRPDASGRVGMLVQKVEYGVAYGEYLYPSITAGEDLAALKELDTDSREALETWNAMRRPTQARAEVPTVEFGKYAGMPVRELIRINRGYARWAYHNIDRFRKLIDENGIRI